MRSKRSSPWLVAAWLVSAALALAARTSSAVPFTFTLVADDSGPFEFIAPVPPSINAAGTVAFEARLAGGPAGIFTGTGAVPNVASTIADSSGPFARLSGPSINAAGTVAFFATLDAGGQGIFSGTGAVPNATDTIADTSGRFDRIFVTPAIDAGESAAPTRKFSRTFRCLQRALSRCSDWVYSC